MYEIVAVDGVEFADTLERFNALDPYFPALEPRHFTDGFWWLAFQGSETVAFCGLVPMEPFVGYGYCKRCLVLPDHRGHGIQYRMLMAREAFARSLRWTHLVTECTGDNRHSANSIRRAGFEPFEPEQRWGVPGSLYWIKRL